MTFTFETQYNTKTMAVMAKALRKTIRKKHSRRSHIYGCIVFILAILLMFSGGFEFDSRTIITLTALVIITATLIFEDKLNAYFANKRLLPGTEKAHSVFSENSFISTTEIGKTEWNYDMINIIAESSDFFVFIFSKSHAQLYDKRTLQGGTVNDFRSFIETACGKKIHKI